MSGWHVTANDIRRWTETEKRQAEAILPQLVKRLALASCNPKSIDFPSGDNVAVGGWDGLLYVEKGNRFIPSGWSGWEFGTNSAVKKKADSDFSKRTRNPDPLSPKESTFIFVSSRLWTKRDGWARTKDASKKWRNVRGINAESLAEWLEECPAVHRWFAELLGKRFSSVWDVEQAWSEFSSKTKTNLSSDFFRHGREEESKILLDLIDGKADVHRVQAASVNESYGFILSVLCDLDWAVSKCVVIKSQESWDLMSTGHSSLILIPLGFTPTGLGLAAQNGNHVLLPVDEKENANAVLKLDRQPRLVREEAFRKLGLNREESAVLFQETKGFFDPILRHQLMGPLDYTKPSWPEVFPSDILFAVLFATEWNEDNENDRDVISQLSGYPYKDLQEYLINLSKVDDPPIRQIGEVWQVISKVDFWLLIHYKLAKRYLINLGETISLVFPDFDPSFTMPADKRYMASIKGATPRYSSLLKRGLSDSLALISMFGDENSGQLGGLSARSQVDSWVRDLFSKHNSPELWFSLGRCTQSIAEASPNEFLDAVEQASSGSEPLILGLFEAEGDGFFGGCYHSDLLWGLELISWNKKYLARVSSCLARLSEIDPGGKWNNRPFNSLVDIYLGWINNTSATHEERLQLIKDLLFRQFPEVAWKLSISLLLNNRTSTSGLAKPEYKEWSRSVEDKPLQSEYFGYISSLVDILIKNVSENLSEETLELLDNFDSFSDSQCRSILNIFENIDVSRIDDDLRLKLLDCLREKVSRHREFHDAEWAIPAGILDELEKIYTKFQFEDPVFSKIYLFNDFWPSLIHPFRRRDYGYEERTNIVSELRSSALTEIYQIKGAEGISELCVHTNLPNLVGNAAYRSDISESVKELALDSLLASDAQADFGRSYLESLARDDFSSIKEIFEDEKLNDSIKFEVILCFPITADSIDFVDSLDEKFRTYFWQNARNYFCRDDSLASLVALSLLEHERPLAAIDSLGTVLHSKKVPELVDSRLVFDILTRIVTDPTDINRISFANVRNTIPKGIEFIQDQDDLPEEEIRQLEWAYLKVFRSEEVAPRYLIELISQEPDFFCQLITWVWKRQDGKEDAKEDLTQDAIKNRAEMALELLHSFSGLPGMKGNTIDRSYLQEWVGSARAQLKDLGRSNAGDYAIAKILANSPVGKDGVWPHEAVREVIEKTGSPKLDQSLCLEKRNNRGVTSRHPYSGGDQERELAKSYRQDAASVQLLYPRTSEILDAIATAYEHDAEREDREAELR